MHNKPTLTTLARLEKSAKLGTLIPGLKGVANASRGGYRKAIEYTRRFKSPIQNVGKSDFINRPNIKLPRNVAIDPSIRRGPLTSLGNTADNLGILGEGVSGKGIIGGARQVGRNAANLIKKQ